MPTFRIVRFLGSLFTPDFNISNSLKIANTAVEVMGDRLDGPPSILPIPQDAPPEIPRITLISSDKKLSISISLQRTNLFFVVPVGIDTGEIDINEYSSISSMFFSEFQKRLDLKIQRMAFVTERVEFRKDALTYILKRFSNKSQIEKGRPFYNAKRFEIHSLKKYDWQGFSINSWVRAKFLPISKKGAQQPEPILLVENDLNTLSTDEDPGAKFTENDIKKFFERAPIHIEEILELYFT